MKTRTAPVTALGDGALPDGIATKLDQSQLTLEDAALLLGGNAELPILTVRRVAEMSRTDPRLEEHYVALEVLARDAGFLPVRDENLETALICHRDFDRLLEAEGWEHPSEVLDPRGEIGISYREMVLIAEARARRALDAGRVRAVKEKLERAWAQQRAKDAPVVRFVARLLEHDDQTAEQLLRQASIEYQRRRGKL